MCCCSLNLSNCTHFALHAFLPVKPRSRARRRRRAAQNPGACWTSWQQTPSSVCSCRWQHPLPKQSYDIQSYQLHPTCDQLFPAHPQPSDITQQHDIESTTPYWVWLTTNHSRWHVSTSDHTVSPATHTFIQKWTLVRNRLTNMTNGKVTQSYHHHTPTVLQPFFGTTQVSRCQKRTSGLYGARED